MKEEREHPTPAFALLVRTYRKSQGWTQSELAEYWSYSFETISAWERGKRFPARTEIARLAQLLEKDVEELAALVAVSKGVPMKQEPPLMASRIPSRRVGKADDAPLPFPQGRLLWTLQLGMEDGGLKCIASCPLDHGGTWDIVLDAEDDVETVQQVYHLLQARMFFRSETQEVAVSAGSGKIVSLSWRSHG